MRKGQWCEMQKGLGKCKRKMHKNSAVLRLRVAKGRSSSVQSCAYSIMKDSFCAGVIMPLVFMLYHLMCTLVNLSNASLNEHTDSDMSQDEADQPIKN